MIYTIGKQRLNIPESGPKRKERTPRQVVPWRDMAETCRTLDAIIQTMDIKKPVRIFDAIARSGFWGALFRNQYPKCKLWLNEAEESCAPLLKKNFPKAKITSIDIKKWKRKFQSDIVFIDFDTFTLHILPEWINVLEEFNECCQYLMFVDAACFGFKFGNMRHYGVKKEEDYYYLLNKTLVKTLDKRITKVSKFINAAAVLMEKSDKRKIEFIPPSDLFMSRGGKKYKDNIRKKPKTLL